MAGGHLVDEDCPSQESRAKLKVLKKSEQFNQVDHKKTTESCWKNSTSVINCETMRHKLMPSTCENWQIYFFLYDMII